MDDRVTIASLQVMKAQRAKVVGVVAWDYQMAQIVDRAGVDIVSVGDTVGLNLWGRPNPLEVTMDEMVVVGRAVRRGVRRALMSCDFPFGPLQEGVEEAVRAAERLIKETGADMVKLDGAADFPEAVSAIAESGIPVFAQFGITPQSAAGYGIDPGSTATTAVDLPDGMVATLLSQAKLLEQAGAVILDFTNSGPVAGPAVVDSVSIPVVGGFGGGPWLDGRMLMATRAIGYSAAALDTDPEMYANVAGIVLGAIEAYAQDVRGGRQIKGIRPAVVEP